MPRIEIEFLLGNETLARLGGSRRSDLVSADWHRRREIIRTLVQRIDIAHEIIKVIFRLTPNARGSAESIVITLARR